MKMNTEGLLLRILLGISILLNSCSQKGSVEKDADGCVVLDLNEALRTAPLFKLSDIVSSIEYVPLETSDSCLLPGSCRVDCITDSYIMLSSLNQVPYLFDCQGNFLNRIGVRGQGPGEIQYYVEGGCIDSDTKEVTLFLDGLHTMCFDIQGKFLREDQLSVLRFHEGETHYRSPHLPLYLHMGNEDRTFYFHFNPDSTRVFMSDTYAREETLKPLPGIYGVAYEAKPQEHYLGYDNIHYETNYDPSFSNQSDYLGYFDGQIGSCRYYRFYYEDGHVENPFRIEFDQVDTQKGMSILLKEVGDYIFMGIMGNNLTSYFFVYDEREGKVYRGGDFFENDVDNGFDFFPYGCTPDGCYLWGIAYMSDLKKQSELSDNDDFRTFVGGLEEDANPVIIFGKLKKTFLKK